MQKMQPLLSSTYIPEEGNFITQRTVSVEAASRASFSTGNSH